MTQETNTDRFIESYKIFENILREKKHCSVYEYENNLSQPDLDKLRICRQIRNYIQHHEDGEEFLSCTELMCTFIENMTTVCSEEFSGRIQKMQPITMDSRLNEIEKTLLKTKNSWMPVVDGQRYVGIIALSKLIFLTAHNNPNTKLSSAIGSGGLTDENISVITKSYAEDFEGQNAVVINDSGHYVGIIKY